MENGKEPNSRPFVGAQQGYNLRFVISARLFASHFKCGFVYANRTLPAQMEFIRYLRWNTRAHPLHVERMLYVGPVNWLCVATRRPVPELCLVASWQRCIKLAHAAECTSRPHSTYNTRSIYLCKHAHYNGLCHRPMIYSIRRTLNVCAEFMSIVFEWERPAPGVVRNTEIGLLSMVIWCARGDWDWHWLSLFLSLSLCPAH